MTPQQENRQFLTELSDRAARQQADGMAAIVQSFTHALRSQPLQLPPPTQAPMNQQQQPQTRPALGQVSCNRDAPPDAAAAQQQRPPRQGFVAAEGYHNTTSIDPKTGTPAMRMIDLNAYPRIKCYRCEKTGRFADNPLCDAPANNNYTGGGGGQGGGKVNQFEQCKLNEDRDRKLGGTSNKTGGQGAMAVTSYEADNQQISEGAEYSQENATTSQYYRPQSHWNVNAASVVTNTGAGHTPIAADTLAARPANRSEDVRSRSPAASRPTQYRTREDRDSRAARRARARSPFPPSRCTREGNSGATTTVNALSRRHVDGLRVYDSRR